MKIHFLIYDIYGMGGTVRTILNVANYLAENNYDIEIISVFRKRKNPFFEVDPNIQVTVLHDATNRQKNAKGLKARLSNWLLKRKSRLIHPDDEAYQSFSRLTDIKMTSYLTSLKKGILITTRPSFNLFAAKHANKDVLLIGEEHLNYDIYPERLQKSLRKYYSNLDYLITLTDADTQTYRGIFPGNKPRILKITNSVPKYEGPISSLEEKTVIAAGRLAPQKGFDILIDAFAKVVEKHPDWKLKIFGFGRERENLQKQIMDNRLYNNIILMGSTRNMSQELAGSSIYALSSRYEGFGMVLVEAMQCGVPVVSFDCPQGPAEIIADNEDGILVENGNVEEFSNGLLKLIENEPLRKQYGQNAINNVKRFEIENIGRQWIQFLNSIDKKS